ncbi:MAG: HAMP domain-containing histidine kinase [Planctomycetales bacterium]|nr:HAMP domain-containing histidine kinase [Planctomycetales bacterium]
MPELQVPSLSGGTAATKPSLIRRIQDQLTFSNGLTALTVIFIAAFFRIAGEDRLLVNLYYIAIAGSAYALVKRRALAQMVLVTCMAAGTTLANVYFTTPPDSWDPLLDPLRDAIGWSVLLFVFWRLGLEAFRFQTAEHKREIERFVEERTVEMRAAALTSTSHEVRTPLSAILAINETLLSGTAGELNEIQKDFLGDIQTAAEHLMSLVNDLLDFAKAEAGMIELTRERIALAELVDQCIAMVEPKAEEKQVSITAKIEGELKELVADPMRLKQMLLNLLANAVKFNEEKGLVNIQVRSDGPDVLISVRDTGRGIGSDQLPHLFDPYYQAARGDQGIGTGLGLSIIRHLAELHHGDISVESVQGAGSVFTIRLPRFVEPDVVPDLPMGDSGRRSSVNKSAAEAEVPVGA